MAPLFKKEQIEAVNTIVFDRRLNVDPQQMEQVLINLLTNCVYALGGTKKQSIISAKAKDKRTFIMITDNGNSIEKEIENKIFLPFFTTRKEDVGIGLTLSKNIVEAHGGYLAYRNDDEKTTFVICLVDS